MDYRPSCALGKGDRPKTEPSCTRIERARKMPTRAPLALPHSGWARNASTGPMAGGRPGRIGPRRDRRALEGHLRGPSGRHERAANAPTPGRQQLSGGKHVPRRVPQGTNRSPVTPKGAHDSPGLPPQVAIWVPACTRFGDLVGSAGTRPGRCLPVARSSRRSRDAPPRRGPAHDLGTSPK